MPTSNYIHSPLNYIGGKYKLLPQLLPLFPQKIGTFVDLFFGGGNVGINISAEKYLFNDNLSYLIELYERLQKSSLSAILQFIENRIAVYGLSLTNEAGYKALRDSYNTEREALDLFMLAAYSFNHQIRFNNAHEFNNPFGRGRSHFNAAMKENLCRFVLAMQKKDISFKQSNFDELDLSFLTTSDFVYCDPPYLITTGTYNDGKRGFTGWTEKEEKSLYGLLDSLHRRNIPFALSNVLIHKGKENFLLKIWIEKNRYEINYLKKDYSNSNYHTADRSKTSSVEVLITNYKPVYRNSLFCSE